MARRPHKMRRTIDCLPPGCPRRLSLVVRFSVHGDVDVHPYSHLQSLLALLLGRLLGRPFDWSLSGYLSAIDSVGLERRRALSAQHRRNKSAWLKTSSAGCRRWHGRLCADGGSRTRGTQRWTAIRRSTRRRHDSLHLGEAVDYKGCSRMHKGLVEGVACVEDGPMERRATARP